MFASSYSLSLSLGTGKKKNKRQEQVQYSSTKTASDWSKSCVFKIKNKKKIYSWKFLEQNRTFTVQHLLTAASYLDRPTYLIEYIYSILFSYFWYSTVITCYSLIETLLHTFCYCHTFCVSLFLLELVMTKK